MQHSPLTLFHASFLPICSKFSHPPLLILYLILSHHFFWTHSPVLQFPPTHPEQDLQAFVGAARVRGARARERRCSQGAAAVRPEGNWPWGPHSHRKPGRRGQVGHAQERDRTHYKWQSAFYEAPHDPEARYIFTVTECVISCAMSQIYHAGRRRPGWPAIRRHPVRRPGAGDKEGEGEQEETGAACQGRLQQVSRRLRTPWLVSPVMQSDNRWRRRVTARGKMLPILPGCTMAATEQNRQSCLLVPSSAGDHRLGWQASSSLRCVFVKLLIPYV